MNNSLVKSLNAICQDKFKSLITAVNKEESELCKAALTGRYLSSLKAPLFNQEQLDSTEWCGYNDFEDAKLLRGLSIIPDIQTHYKLYGKSQGRDILERLENTDVSKVLLIAPSYGKQCGIGEYGRYLESSFKAIGKNAYSFRTSAELLAQSSHFVADALVLVNHGPGLFDGFNPKLGQGESTKTLLQNLLSLRNAGALPAVLMHSLIDTDQELLYSRQQMILNSDIPTITFIKDASRHFYIPQVELGVSPVKKPKKRKSKQINRSERDEVVGFFGFFQYGGKDFDALFHLVRSIRAKLVGSVATSNVDELNRFEKVLENSDITHELGSGWVTDTELAERLSKADYFYLPQNDYDHWNNSATARFVMNLDKPVFLPAHKPFIDVEDGVVFATTEDLPRVVSHFRQDDMYSVAVQRSIDFRKKADMRNTAKKLLNGVYSDFKEYSQKTIVAHNDTSFERFLNLSDERKTLYLSTKEIHTPFLISDAVSLLNAGVFTSIHKSVEAIEFWRKHYNLEDFVQNSVLESVHSIFQSICKRPMELSELVSICRYKVEHQSVTTPGDLLSHAIKVALSSSDGVTIFNKPNTALYHNCTPVNEEHLSPDVFNELIQKSIETKKTVRELDVTELSYQPYINNVFDMLVLPYHVIDQRRFSIDISMIDMKAVLSQDSLYERYNMFIDLCTHSGINIAETALVDQPNVRSVEHQRMNYVVEDFIFFENELFVLNAVRCLFKRDPFPIEMLALGNMLDSLGKLDVLNYLTENINCRVNKFNLSTDHCTLIEQAYTRFCEVMRDPISGGVDLRNRYLVEKRNNLRWYLKIKTTNETFMNQVGRDTQALLALYYHLNSVESEFEGSDSALPGFGHIENWLTLVGTFISPNTVRSSMISLSSQQPLKIRNIDDTQKMSMINFQKIETEGAWTKECAAHMMFTISDEQQSEYDYSITIRLRSYGSEKIPDREVCVSVISDIPYSNPTETRDFLTDDAAKSFTLPLADADVSKYFIAHFYISSTTNPHKLEESPDNRDLGLMIQQIEINRTKKVGDELPNSELTKAA